MLFTSYAFLGFIAVLFLLYYLIPRRMQWGLLLIASYLFYFIAGPSWLLYLLATTMATYLAARRIEEVGVRQKAYIKAYGLICSGTGILGDGTATFKVYKKPVVDIVVGLKGV